MEIAEKKRAKEYSVKRVEFDYLEDVQYKKGEIAKTIAKSLVAKIITLRSLEDEPITTE